MTRRGCISISGSRSARSCAREPFPRGLPLIRHGAGWPCPPATTRWRQATSRASTKGQARGSGAVIIWDEGPAQILRDEPGHLSVRLQAASSRRLCPDLHRASALDSGQGPSRARAPGLGYRRRASSQHPQRPDLAGPGPWQASGPGLTNWNGSTGRCQCSLPAEPAHHGCVARRCGIPRRSSPACAGRPRNDSFIAPAAGAHRTQMTGATSRVLPSLGSCQRSERHVAKSAHQTARLARTLTAPGSAAVGPTRSGDRLLAARIPTLWQSKERAQNPQGRVAERAIAHQMDSL